MARPLHVARSSVFDALKKDPFDGDELSDGRSERGVAGEPSPPSIVIDREVAPAGEPAPPAIAFCRIAVELPARPRVKPSNALTASPLQLQFPACRQAISR
jgi:hypothetical protein